MDSENESTSDSQTDLLESGSASFGDRLRAAREAKRLELSHIAAETRIPERHLQSIETGNLEALPSRTYAVGFAKSFARAVGLDEEPIAEAVRAEFADGYSRTYSGAGALETDDPAKLPSSGLAWFGGLAAILLTVGLIFFYNTYFGAGTGPGSLLADEEAAQGQEALADGSSGQGEAGATQAAPSAGGQVVLTATGEGAWVRFYEEGGERLFEGVMESGDTYEVPLDAQDPRLNTGRPNLLSITVGGQAVPPISEVMVPVADAPVSAEALLARAQPDAQSASGPLPPGG